MEKREINIILAYPGTCVDVQPSDPNFIAVQGFDAPTDNDIAHRTATAVGILSKIKEDMSKTDDSIMFILPWFQEIREVLARENMYFTTVLPKTHKSQDWFMRLIDSGYGFNQAATALEGFSDLFSYKPIPSYEKVYYLNTDMDLEFKDLRALVRHGRIRVLELRLFLADMVPYPEIFLFWLAIAIGMHIGMKDKVEGLVLAVQLLAYTIGLNYVFKSSIMRRRDKEKYGRK